MKKIYHKGNAGMITKLYGLFPGKRHLNFDSRSGGTCCSVRIVSSIKIVSHKSNLKDKLGKLPF